MKEYPFVHLHPEGVLLEIYVQPGASKTGVAGEFNSRLKIRISAPAVEDKANEACLRFLADLLEIKPRDLQMRSGEKSRLKTILWIGGSAAALEEKIKKFALGVCRRNTIFGKKT